MDTAAHRHLGKHHHMLAYRVTHMRFTLKVQSRPTALLDVARREQAQTASDGNGGLWEGYGSHLVNVSKKYPLAKASTINLC